MNGDTTFIVRTFLRRRRTFSCRPVLCIHLRYVLWNSTYHRSSPEHLRFSMEDIVVLSTSIVKPSISQTWDELSIAWWRHQMETFSALLAICAGNSPVPDEFPHKGQWGGALMFSLICVWINDRVNNNETGDLRRYRALYDVTVMDWNFSGSAFKEFCLSQFIQTHY